MQRRRPLWYNDRPSTGQERPGPDGIFENLSGSIEPRPGPPGPLEPKPRVEIAGQQEDCSLIKASGAIIVLDSLT